MDVDFCTTEVDPLRPQHPDQMEHVGQVLQMMRRNERSVYRRPSVHQIDPFLGEWREQIVHWMYTLVKYCKLRHEAAAAGSYFLDSAVANGVIRTSADYQLGAMAALYLALKVFDSPSMRIVKLASLVKLGNGEFGEADVVRMEMNILTTLQWRTNPPTPNCFVQQYLELFPAMEESSRQRIEEIAFQAIEVCVAKEYFCCMKPSLQGYSALLYALEQYLANQTTKSIPALETREQLSTWQLHKFLHNMTTIAKQDHTSLPILQTTTLLGRAVQGQTITPMNDTDGNNKSTCFSNGRKVTCNEQGQTYPTHAASPNNVMMH